MFIKSVKYVKNSVIKSLVNVNPFYYNFMRTTQIEIVVTLSLSEAYWSVTSLFTIDVCSRTTVDSPYSIIKCKYFWWSWMGAKYCVQQIEYYSPCFVFWWPCPIFFSWWMMKKRVESFLNRTRNYDLIVDWLFTLLSRMTLGATKDI